MLNLPNPRQKWCKTHTRTGILVGGEDGDRDSCSHIVTMAVNKQRLETKSWNVYGLSGLQSGNFQMHNKGLDHDVNQILSNNSLIVCVACAPNQNGLRRNLRRQASKKGMPIGQLGFQCVWMWNPSPVDRISYSTTVSGIVPFSSKSIHELLNRITWSPGHCGVVHLCSSINISVASPATKQLEQIKSRIQKLESTRAKSTKKKRACPFLTKKST